MASSAPKTSFGRTRSCPKNDRRGNDQDRHERRQGKGDPDGGPLDGKKGEKSKAAGPTVCPEIIENPGFDNRPRSW